MGLFSFSMYDKVFNRTKSLLRELNPKLYNSSLKSKVFKEVKNILNTVKWLGDITDSDIDRVSLHILFVSITSLLHYERTHQYYGKLTHNGELFRDALYSIQTYALKNGWVTHKNFKKFIKNIHSFTDGEYGDASCYGIWSF